MSNKSISRSLYCSGVQCPKMLWLKKYRKDIPVESDKSVYEVGNKVGDLAMSLLGDYVEVPYCEDKREMADITLRLIEEGQKAICEASFIIDNLFCSLDILHILENGSVEFYEVKSSGSLKDAYIPDCAFQLNVLERLGFEVESVYLVNIDTSYVRQGELDIRKLFKINDITSIVYSLQGETRKNIDYLTDYLSIVREPEHALHMGCFSPYKCDYWDYCAGDLPSPSVFDISRLNKSRMLEFYSEGKIRFEDLLGAERLSDSQRLQIDSYLSQKTFINVPEIRKFMAQLSYPLYFLDFESFQPAIPPYDGTWPYEQIPFQFSLHWIDSPDQAVPYHFGYIAPAGSDPRHDIAEMLCLHIPSNVCVTAYYMSFEKERIRELADLYPEYHDHLMSIYGNIIDLEKPFSRHLYYCPDMNGSSSIKVVLPALFPDDENLNYSRLEGVHRGDEASATYEAMSSMGKEEYESCYRQLWEYCKLDTFALFKIWQKLNEVM